MAWKIEANEGVVIVEMNSNKANLHNPAFFDDFHAAMDAVNREYPRLPAILTAPGKIFSAGIDFEYSFKLFQRNDPTEVGTWFGKYSAMMLRLFQAPRMTIAAINGHTFAGGAIFALCCDFRLMADGPFKFSINEVPVGVPMPSVYTEIIRARLGNAAATETILSGEIYDVKRAQELFLIKKAVAPDQLIAEALKQARCISPDTYTAYAHSKKMLQAPTLKLIREMCPELEKETVRNICAQDSVKAQLTAFKNLQKSGSATDF